MSETIDPYELSLEQKQEEYRVWREGHFAEWRASAPRNRFQALIVEAAIELMRGGANGDLAYALQGVLIYTEQLLDRIDPPRNSGCPPPTRRKHLGPNVRKEVLERDAYRCQGCGSWRDLHIDHIKPLAAGGGNELENLQVLCAICNLSKGAHYE